MDEHQQDCACSLCALHALDEATDWEQPGSMLAVNDPEDGDSSVAVLPTNHRGPDGGGEGLDTGEEVDSILSCVQDMYKQNVIDELVVIVNMKDEDQLMFTTFNRNDLIIGCLETAKLNWRDTQIMLQNSREEGEC